MSSVQLGQNIDTLIDPQFPAVQTDMIISCIAPLHIRVELIISRPALIFFFAAPHHRIFGHTVLIGDPLIAYFLVRVNENGKAVSPCPQDVVRAAPDDHTGFLVCKLRDDLTLDIPKIILSNNGFPVSPRAFFLSYARRCRIHG